MEEKEVKEKTATIALFFNPQGNPLFNYFTLINTLLHYKT